MMIVDVETDSPASENEGNFRSALSNRCAASFIRALSERPDTIFAITVPSGRTVNCTVTSLGAPDRPVGPNSSHIGDKRTSTNPM